MPKITQSNSNKLQQIVKQYGQNIFSTDNKVLLCLCCSIQVNHTKKYFIEQHLNTAKHKSAVALKSSSNVQFVTPFAENTNVTGEFNSDLTRMMVACDIALHKLKQPEFKRFLEKYTGKKLPEESMVRKKYVNQQYEDVIEQIRCGIGESNIYISIDETTDKEGRALCNVVVGALRKDGRGFLIASEVIDKVNASTIAMIFDNTLKVLWPEGVHRERVLVFISDAAPYMIKSGKTLKLLYPRMLHITCIAHGVHRVCEKIRSQFPDVDSLISNAKKIFIKCNSRVALFKKKHPEIPLPPKPVLTRWGTWLQAAIYYAKYFEELKQFIENLNEDAASIIFTKNILSNGEIKSQLAYILSAYGFIVDPKQGVLTKLQKRGVSIDYGIQILDLFQNGLKEAVGPVGEAVYEKFTSTLSKNSDLQILKEVNMVLTGSNCSLPDNITVKDVESLKWAPLVSAEVERTFSSFKAMMRDNRRRMLPKNYSKHLIALCFYNTISDFIEID